MRSLIKFNDYLFDTEKGTIFFNDEQIHLEHQQSKLLVLLIENYGSHVSREQISQEIWQGVIVEDNTISKAITRLRKVLNDNAKNPSYIRTVPKKGYQFIAEFEVTEKESLNAPSSVAPVPPSNSSELSNKGVATTRKSYRTPAAIFAAFLLLVSVIFWAQDDSINDDSANSGTIDNGRFNNSASQASVDFQASAITYREGLEHNAHLNPDTLQLLFIGNINKGYGIFNQAIGASAKYLTRVNSRIASPKWLNSENFVYSDITSTNECKIYVIAVSKPQDVKELSSCVSPAPVQLFVNKKRNDLIWQDSSGVWQLNLETNQRTRLPFNSQNVTYSMPSPDRSMWASLSEDAEKSVISIIDFDSQAHRYQIQLPYLVTHFKWAYSGDAIYHLSEHPANRVIKHQLTGEQETVMVSSVAQIIQISDVESANSIEVVTSTIDLDVFKWHNGMETPVINSPFPDYNPAKSPVSGDIAFASKRTGSAQIWLKQANGELAKLTNFPRASYIYEIVWSPNGKHLLVKRNSNVYLLNIDTNEVKELSVNAENNIRWQWLSDHLISYVDKTSHSLFTYDIKSNNLVLVKTDVGYAQWLNGEWLISDTENRQLMRFDHAFNLVGHVSDQLNGRFWLVNSDTLYLFNDNIDTPDSFVRVNKDKSETVIFSRKNIQPLSITSDNNGSFIYHRVSNNEANVYQKRIK